MTTTQWDPKLTENISQAVSRDILLAGDLPEVTEEKKPRKERSDKGKPRGKYKPRQPKELLTSTTEIGGGYVGAEITREVL